MNQARFRRVLYAVCCNELKRRHGGAQRRTRTGSMKRLTSGLGRSSYHTAGLLFPFLTPPAPPPSNRLPSRLPGFPSFDQSFYGAFDRCSNDVRTHARTHARARTHTFSARRSTSSHLSARRTIRHRSDRFNRRFIGRCKQVAMAQGF